MSDHDDSLHQKRTRTISLYALGASALGIIISFVATLNSCSQADTSDKTLRLTQVAYVSANKFSFFPPVDNFAPSATVALTNSGNTPAFGVKRAVYSDYWDKGTKEKDIHFRNTGINDDRYTILEPKDTKGIGVITFTKDQYDKALRGDGYLVVYGEYLYKDVLGTGHHGEFCFQTFGISKEIKTGATQFLGGECPVHNCYDKECH